ncbi:MAG TPA: rod shape-determining protein MreD [Planctomycetota bacterium]|nr:rod shape-determining protein MreD [Planctomycetota bacterium]
MSAVAWVVFASVAALADVLVSPVFELGSARPEMCVGVLGLWWMSKPGERASWLGAWVVGLARDTLSIGPLGFHALVFVLVAWGFGELQRVWSPSDSMGRFLLVAGAVSAAGWLTSGLSFAFGTPPTAIGGLLSPVTSGVLTSAAVVVVPSGFAGIRTWVRNAYARLQWQ